MEYNPPNTRERIAARRRSRQTTPTRTGSQVRPGPRRALGQWVVSGRLFSLVLFFATMGALAYLFLSPRFQIHQVQVEGNNALSAEVVADLSDMNGVSIWFVDGDAVVQRLFQSPYVEQASVRVTLPDRAIVSLVERRAEVRWQLNGVQYLVDSSGKVLDLAQSSAETQTLVIMDTSRHALNPGDQVDPDALKLAQALALRLPAELKFTPATIGWDFALGVYARSDSGQTIVFGQSEHLDRKLAIFDYLLKDKTAFTYLDLRPSNPFYQNDQRPATNDQPAP